MDRKLINPSIVSGIADAVRAKGKTTAPIKVADLPSAIMALPEGGGVGEDTSALLDAIGVESREDVAMANGLAVALTDAPTEQVWSGERESADGMPIKDGVAFVSALKGKTMKVNQLVNINIADITMNGVTIKNNHDGTFTANGTAEGGAGYTNTSKVVYSGHRYFLCGCPKGGGGSTYKAYTTNTLNITDYGNGVFGTSSGNGTTYIVVAYVANGASVSNLVFRPQLFDLTEMFGSGNEPTTADDFAQRLGYASIDDLPYIPYQTTNLQSFAPNAIVSKGRNLLDMSDFENWYKPSSSSVLRKAFKLKPNTKYTLSSNVDRGYNSSWCFIVSGKDIDFAASSYTNGATQANNYQRVVTTDQQGFLTIGVWDVYQSTEEKPLLQLEEGETKTDYTPYIAPSRLPFDLTTIVDADGNQLFPEGELRSAGSVADLVDFVFDISRGKGMAHKRIARFNLGECNWGVHNASRQIYRTNGIPFKVPAKSSIAVNMNVAEYRVVPNSVSWVDGDCSNSGAIITICDTRYPDASSFKAAMQGVFLEVELATPIDEEFDLPKSFYPVQSNGTEEAVCDSIVPFNGDIRYRVDTESLLTQSTALLAYSNEVTGANNTSLGDAVKTLTDSYK